MASSTQALRVAREPHLTETCKVVNSGWTAYFTFRTLVSRDDSLVGLHRCVRLGPHLSVVAPSDILTEDVRRVSIVRQELLHHKGRLDHALVDRRFNCSCSPDSVGLLLARREEERVLVALTLCSVYSFHLHMMVDIDRNLLPQELLLAA